MTHLEPTIIETHPHVARSCVKLLWHSTFWDGPLSGLLVYQEEMCWYEMIIENEDDSLSWYRRFAIIRLEASQLADELYWHELFRQHVGSHTDYGDDQRRTPATILPREGWNQFYDNYAKRLKPDYSTNLILGWFEL